MLRGFMPFAIVLGIHASALGGVIQVPADHPTIQQALAAASDGDEIIVAPGIYNEHIDLLGKAVTLRSSDGPTTTVIDAGGLGDSVVLAESGEGNHTVLEGFTLRGGIGHDDGGTRYGGGMYVVGGAPAVIDCVFDDNHAGIGGGMYNLNSAPSLSGCVFSNNTADAGGGLYNVSSSPAVLNCQFLDNSSFGSGGGMLNWNGSDPQVVGSRFIGNTADGWGGGMYNIDGSVPTVINCEFIANQAGAGGGMNNHNFSDARVLNCTFVGNMAERGAGMFNHSDGNPEVSNCTFYNNVAGVEGGGMASNYSAVQSPTVNSCVFWANTPDQFFNLVVPPPTVSNSTVEGAWPGNGNIDDDPMFVDPAGADGVPGTEDDDLRLLPGSPCIDSGDNSAVPPDELDLDGDGNTAEPLPVDLNGDPRFVDDPGTPDCGLGATPIVDMGAYEFQGSTPFFCLADVDRDAQVNAADLAQLLGHWGPSNGCMPDLNADGVVNAADLATLLGAWGACP